MSPLVVVGAWLVIVVLIIRPHCLSSSFSNIVHPNDELLVVGGVHRLRAVIAVSIECGGGRVVVCVLGGPLSLVGGWGECSSSGGLSWVVCSHSVVDQAWWWWAVVSLCDACPCSWVLMKGGWCHSCAFIPILCCGERLSFVGGWDGCCVQL